MIMNSCEIDCAVQRLQGVDIYHDAALFLARFRDLIDSISDGWAYWGYGTKCSEPLQQIISDGQWPARRQPREATIRAVAEYTAKIKTFLRRCKQTRDRPEVIEFLKIN